MRDVTDSVTGELVWEDQKRGRGRPRKEHALTNAERQAAFRARRKAQQPIEVKSVTKCMAVTEMLSDVDAYDECRLEVEKLCGELEQARRDVRDLQVSRDAALDRVRELFVEIGELKLELAQKSVTPSNGNPVSFDAMLDLLALAAKANTFEQRQKVRESELWVDSFVCTQAVSEAQMLAAAGALYGDRKVVTRKA
ncbi:hypothetical protein ACQUJO_22520 [Ralstonia pseudosolanacearum]